MKYKLEKVGSPGDLHIEEEDVLTAQPCSDGLHIVELTLQPRPQYTYEEGYSARRDKAVVLLVARQAQALIEQDRAAQKPFCKPCFDYGHKDRPGDCVRCQLIEAYRKAGKGDLRKVRPASPRQASAGMTVAFIVTLLAFWWSLTQWAHTYEQLGAARSALAGCAKERTARK